MSDFCRAKQDQEDSVVSMWSLLITALRGPKAKGRFIGRAIAIGSAQSVQSVYTTQLRDRARLQMVKAYFALALYKRRTGRFPDSLESLVPRYLKRIPEDPFVSMPMRYRLAGDKIRLYSVGPDGQDQDGVNQLDGGGDSEGDDIELRPQSYSWEQHLKQQQDRYDE